MDQLSKDFHFTLMRHGESVGNVGGYLQGHMDFPLSDKGYQQVTTLANLWKSAGFRFDRVISGGLSHARQSAEIVASILDAPMEIDNDWKEIDNGILAGMRISEADEKYPQPEFMNPYQAIGQTGESDWELFLRAGRAVQRLTTRPPGRYLIVAHGGILNMALRSMLGVFPQANFQGGRFIFHNTGYALITYSPSQHWWSLEALINPEYGVNHP
jgi:broad specificity phosphatase PhoE